MDGRSYMENCLKTNNLTKTYGETTVVNKVNVTVRKGDIYGLIGRNGAGKSTLMKMVGGLVKPTSGDFKLFDGESGIKVAGRIGCMIEDPALYPDMSARDNLLYYNKLLGITDNSNIDEILELVGLENVGKKKTKAFSLGMKQRLSIGIALMGYPDFLLLDEPVNGLDPAGIVEIRNLILPSIPRSLACFFKLFSSEPLPISNRYEFLCSFCNSLKILTVNSGFF